MKSLIEQASDIINQTAHTPDDITELHRIKWKLVNEYAEWTEILWKSTEAYERLRMSTYVKARQANKKDAESKEIARSEATKKYGNKFLYEQFLQGKKQQIQAIRDFCIDYYHKRNEENSASMVLQD